MIQSEYSLNASEPVAYQPRGVRRQQPVSLHTRMHRSVRRLAALLLLLCGFWAAPTRAFADSTGEQSPTSTTPASGSFTTPTNAFACDNTNLAQAQGNNETQIYSVYGLSIPPTAIVTGIQVRVRANDGGSNNRRFTVQLSPDGGSNYFPSIPLRTSNFKRNKPLKNYILGGSAYLWGRAAWSASDLSNANFRVKVVAAKGSSGDPANLDCIPVTVFYDIPGAPN